MAWRSAVDTQEPYERLVLNVAIKGVVGLAASVIPSVVLFRGRAKRSMVAGFGLGCGVGTALTQNAVGEGGPKLVSISGLQKGEEGWRADVLSEVVETGGGQCHKEPALSETKVLSVLSLSVF